MGGSSSSSSKSSSVNKSFNFSNVDYGSGGGSERVAKNINMAESSLKVGDVISTDHGAVSGALDFADSANKRNAETLLALGDKAYDGVENAQELTKELFGQTWDEVNAANRENLQYLNQNTDRALAFAKQATRSEAGEITENLTKYFLIGGAGIVGIVLLTTRR